MDTLVEFRRATLGYGRVRVLEEVDLDVKTGDFLGIVGPNGAGKTTLLKAILGLLRPMAGTVVRESTALRIGYVPQRDSVDTLFPLTVMDIVLMGRYARLGPVGRPRRQDIDLARSALDDVGILELQSRHYPSLSGGEKQRALIARALVGQPNLLILDEPTNGMDLPSEKAIMELVSHLHDQHGITVLMVSHLLNTVVNYAKRIAIVGDGSVREGEISELVTSEALSRLYGTGVVVAHVDGRQIVLPARGNGANGGQTPCTK